jgi:predicted NACHT family NTPase
MILKNSMVKWATRPDDYERIPVFVELYRMNSDDDLSLSDLIAATFRRNGVPRPEGFMQGALAGGYLCIPLDGLDEVETVRRDSVATRIERLAEDYPRCQFIVTCREAVYEHNLRPVFNHEVRISDFDDVAIYRFLRLWLSKDREQQDARYEVEQLVAALRASPVLLRLARSPLLITMIATLYDADPGVGPVLTNSRSGRPGGSHRR